MSETQGAGGLSEAERQAWLKDYEARRLQAKKDQIADPDKKHYQNFMKAHAGKFPKEVLIYWLENDIKIPIPYGELARAFQGERLPGIKNVDTDTTDR